jgi:Putative lumazine-binding
MKTRALTLTILLLWALLILGNAQKKNDDSSAVKATVVDYIEAYYAGDASRMAATLHPRYLKHVIHGDRPIQEKTGADMVEAIRSQGAADLPTAEKIEKVSVMDISGDIASVKLVTPGWTDYLTLAKSDGHWKILSVVQRIDD